MWFACASLVETLPIHHHHQGSSVLVRMKGEAHGKMKVMDAALLLQMARRALTPGRADIDCFRLHGNANHEAPGA
jgi:hypothetical protein